MGVEIERKFLVTDEGWRAAATRSEDMVQGYLADSDQCAVRVRLAGGEARLTIKGAGLSIQRLEYEYPLPPADAEEMLASLCARRVVRKTRYYCPLGAHLFEVDVFAGDNAGLVVAEVELSRADEVFTRPSWLGEEVSGDARYLNNNLAEHPYCDWS